MSLNIMNDFQTFLKFEKKFSKEFLVQTQIFDERFDLDEYDLLESIWKDQDLIDSIYNIIDDLIILHKLEFDKRYLVIGDFLFSLTSFDLFDPSELILKTSRNAYLYRIRTRAAINIIFKIEWAEYVHLHKKLLLGLRINKIITKTQIRTNKKEIGWISTIYFKLELKEDFLDQKIILGTSKFPFIIQEISKTLYSISSFRNIRSVKKKKREMEDVTFSLYGVKQANKTAFTLSSKLFSINKKIIDKEKNKLLNSIKCKSLSEFFDKIKKICKDSEYSHQLLTGKEKIEHLNYKDIYVLERDIKKEYIILIQNFHKIIALQILNKNIFDRVFYLPCFIDNRGRKYYSTLISPTFYILFRYLYDFESKKDFINLKESIFFKKILKYEKFVENLNLDETGSYIALILFIEVGKFFIKNSNNFIIKTEDIIIIGMQNYKLKNIEIDFEDALYLQKIYFLLDNLISKKNIDKNTLIYKDATASGLQNYGILLGYNKEKLEYINLNGDNWCDTYKYIISKFLKSNDNMFLKRKYWKSTIMTIPYNATWYSCFIKFINALRKDNIEYNNLEPEKQIKIKEMHKQFYNDIKKEIKKEFYTNEFNEIKIFKYNKWQVISFEDYKINYQKARDKYRNTFYVLLYDNETTQRALEANNMHYLDALLVEHISERFEILTVHDCFGIRLCELHLVMDEINNYYSQKTKEKTYSIHIII